jgi:hypothetical protein
LPAGIGEGHTVVPLAVEDTMPYEEIEAFIDQLKARAVAVRKLEDSAFRERVKRTDLVVGFDGLTGDMAVFYGRDKLQDIAAGRDAEFDAQRIVVFDYKNDSEELEFICAAVEILKGECDYGKLYSELD